MSERSDEKCEIDMCNMLDFSNGKNVWLDNFNMEMETKRKT